MHTKACGLGSFCWRWCMETSSTAFFRICSLFLSTSILRVATHGFAQRRAPLPSSRSAAVKSFQICSPCLLTDPSSCPKVVTKAANKKELKNAPLSASRNMGWKANLSESYSEARYHGSYSLRHWLQLSDWLPTLETTLALDEEQVRRVGDDSVGGPAVTQQLLIGVNYLHSHGLAHRELRLENFLVSPIDKHVKNQTSKDLCCASSSV